MFKRLFSPLQVNRYNIKNRIVVPPIALFGLPEANDYVQEAHLTHYRELANGGCGLLITESITTDPVHENRAMIGAYDERFVEGLSKLADVCKENGTTVLAQLTNTGLEVMPYRTLAEIPEDQFKAYRDAFVTAAVNCRKAGFDGIELHGAHGFFLNQVIELNNRSDAYGDGNHVLQEIIYDIKERCGADFLVCVRNGNHDMEALICTAKAAETAGADLLHISRGAWEDGDGSLSKHSDKTDLLHAPAPTEAAPQKFPFAYTVYMASRVKREVGIPVICVGDIREAEQAESILANGYADFTALGRQHLADPNWGNKIAEGKAPIPCLNCKYCKWMEDGTGEKCAGRIAAKKR